MPRIRPVTYLDLHSQLTAEQVRAQMVHLEQHVRCAITVAHYEPGMDIVNGHLGGWGWGGGGGGFVKCDMSHLRCHSSGMDVVSACG